MIIFHLCICNFNENIWIWSLFILLICHVFVDNVIYCKSLLENEYNIWIESCYELFIGCVVVTDEINSKLLFRYEQNIWIGSLFNLFIFSVFIDHENQSQMFLSKWAKYLNRIVVEIFHFSCVRRSHLSTRNLSFQIKQNTWIES